MSAKMNGTKWKRAQKKVENHLTNTNNYKSVNLIFEFLFADPKPYQNVNCSTKWNSLWESRSYLHKKRAALNTWISFGNQQHMLKQPASKQYKLKHISNWTIL